jgi:hypothetical protein
VIIFGQRRRYDSFRCRFSRIVAEFSRVAEAARRRDPMKGDLTPHCLTLMTMAGAQLHHRLRPHIESVGLLFHEYGLPLIVAKAGKVARRETADSPRESEHCRTFKELNLLSAHRSSNPICPATESVCRAALGRTGRPCRVDLRFPHRDRRGARPRDRSLGTQGSGHRGRTLLPPEAFR